MQIMKIYDITKELFSAPVYPGDPTPSVETLLSRNKPHPDCCQLSRLTIGSHNGTHLDAPRHFHKNGLDVAGLDLHRCVGPCKVVQAKDGISAKQIEEFLKDGTKRLLIKGESAVISRECARAAVRHGLYCLGVEGMTIGLPDDQWGVHQELLSSNVVILESLCLSEVPSGNYFLAAQPLKIRELDGSPIRAILLDGIKQERNDKT